MKTTGRDKWLKMNDKWPEWKIELTQSLGFDEHQVSKLYPLFQSFFRVIEDEWEERVDVLEKTVELLKGEREAVYKELVEAKAELMMRDKVWHIPDGVDKELHKRGWNFWWNGDYYLYGHPKLTAQDGGYEWVTVDVAWEIEESAQEK